jgi:hypothetical protein
MEQNVAKPLDHPVFLKYTREWLHKVTGYSKTYLSRVASGRVPLSQPFIDRVSFKLNEPAKELFLLDAAGFTSDSRSSRN